MTQGSTASGSYSEFLKQLAATSSGCDPISTALSEIVVGTLAQLVIGAFFVHGELGSKVPDYLPGRHLRNPY